MSTFEELGFLFPEPVAGLPPTAGRRVTVGFRGAVSGELELCVSDSLLPVLAANMLGIAESPVPALQEDALREMANVVCGNLMPIVVGPEAIVHLDAPVIAPGAVTCAADDATATTGADSARLSRNAFQFDEGCAVVTLVVAAPDAR